MPSKTPPPRLIPGLEVVGRGVYLKPYEIYRLKEVLFERKEMEDYCSKETGVSYRVPRGYAVNDSPPMPATQALNQTIIEESWDRFEKRTTLDASLAVSNAPFSVDVTASNSNQLRQEEESYYALRTSFIPLWTVYMPSVDLVPDDMFDNVDIPIPFSHRYRRKYSRFFDRFGTHYVSRVWVGGKAALALIISKQTEMTKSEIQAGLKASMAGVGSAGISTSDQQSKEKLQSNSQCTVFGKGGDELKLASLSTLDNTLYNDWLVTVKDNPQVIEFEAMGIWALIRNSGRPHAQAEAKALMQAYKEETFVSSLRTVFNLDNQIHFFEDTFYHLYDLETSRDHEHADEGPAPPQHIQERWSGLFEVGFERVDSAFLGKYLKSPEGEDLNRKVFFFNRNMFVRWDVDKSAIDPGYPRLIAEGWPGIIFPRVDAVVNVSPESLYFFCGGEYQRFNTITFAADDGYPQPISRRWTGVTFDRIDAATYWGNAKVFFFSGNQYIRYDTVMWRADPGYPKYITSHYVEDWRFFE